MLHIKKKRDDVMNILNNKFGSDVVNIIDQYSPVGIYGNLDHINLRPYRNDISYQYLYRNNMYFFDFWRVFDYIDDSDHDVKNHLVYPIGWDVLHLIYVFDSATNTLMSDRVEFFIDENSSKYKTSKKSYPEYNDVNVDNFDKVQIINPSRLPNDLCNMGDFKSILYNTHHNT
jgi:hypothetical protein